MCPCRVKGAQVNHLDVVLAEIMERFQQSQAIRIAHDEQHQAEDAAAEAEKARVVAPKPPTQNRAQLEHTVQQQAFPLHTLLTMEQALFGRADKQAQLNMLQNQSKQARYNHSVYGFKSSKILSCTLHRNLKALV